MSGKSKDHENVYLGNVYLRKCKGYENVNLEECK